MSALSLQAIQINGSVTFGGTCTLDSGMTVAGATEVTGWFGLSGDNTTKPFVASSSGNLSATGGTTVTMPAPWVFVNAQAALWTYTASDGDTFTFNLNAGSSVSNNGTSLDVSGTGTITATGPHAFDPTFGVWNFTTQNPAGGASDTIFSFSAASGSTPDGGLTVAFLGFALVGIEGLRRKLLSK